MKSPAALVSVGLLAGVLASAAAAQESVKAPDLKGLWRGTEESVVAGAAPFHAGTSALHQPRLSTIEAAMTVEGQEGRRFWGSFARTATAIHSSA